jgi:CNT family concentrative nucleoside transporter
MALLFYFNIIQRVVGVINAVIQPLLGTSGAETLCAIANSFLGQTEAPLLIRHYLRNMTKSEMLVVMVSGMATISGAILVVFVAMGVPAVHLLASSVMSIPAAILISKMLYPETEKANKEVLNATVELEHTSQNVFDAVATGTSDGLQLALNVGAMLISFLALLAMINYGLEFCVTKINSFILLINDYCNAAITWQVPSLTIEKIFGYLFSPFGYLLGFRGQEARYAGELIGTKIAVNELIAYGSMVKMNLSSRANDIMTYALCGFSNFSCIGIQIGGIGALVPEKRGWLTQLGLYAVLGGALANLLSAMVAGLLL